MHPVATRVSVSHKQYSDMKSYRDLTLIYCYHLCSTILKWDAHGTTTNYSQICAMQDSETNDKEGKRKACSSLKELLSEAQQ